MFEKCALVYVRCYDSSRINSTGPRELAGRRVDVREADD